MKQRYEYKFVLLEKGMLDTREKMKIYKDVIESHAKEGWKLVQILQSNAEFFDYSFFCEVILEREHTP